jgi:phospholipid/cholesterol/gamma-HCH transport system substrate-binding protein
MKGWASPFRVGIVMIAAMIATAGMLVRVSRAVVGEGDGYVVTAHFRDATGLSEKSRVVVAGIDVGAVEAVGLDGSRAVVSIRLRPDIVLYGGEPVAEGSGGARLRDAAVITKRRTSLVGAFYLELNPGLRGPRIADGAELPLVVEEITPGAVMEQMSGLAVQLGDIARDVKKVTGNMSTVFGDEKNAQRMQQMIEDVQATVQTLRTVVEGNQRALNHIVSNTEAASEDIRRFVSQTSRDTAQILADVSAITSELRAMVGRSSEDVTAGIGTMRGTLSSAQEALDRINYSLENVQRVTERVERGEGTVGKLLNDPTISDQTAELVTTANSFVQKINDLRTVVEFRSAYGVQDEAFKNVIGLSLMPTADKFYTLELVNDPRGRTRRYSTYNLTTDPSEAPTVYSERQETSDSIEVTLTMGSRWALTPNRMVLVGGRFGMIESRGGVGASLWAWQDALELRADMFDFGVRDRPRVRTAAIWSLSAFVPRDRIWSHLFVHGGVDDWFNDTGRDYFVGAGFSFDDKDLKGVLLAAPTPSF